MALAFHSWDHRLTASGFFPCSIAREYLYGYAGDGYRSPLWLCASHNGSPVLVHRLRGSKIYFHQATKDRGILLIPGIHYFDAYRLQPLLLQAPALQIHLRASPLAGPEGAGETVEDPSSDEERATTDGESEWRRKLKRQIFLLKNHGARQFQTHLMIPRKWKSQVLLTSWPIVLNLKPMSSSNLTN